MNCKRCNDARTVKNGAVRGKQRYKCKSCSYNFVIGDQRSTIPPEKRKIALHLYLEGVSCRAIGRMLGVSNVTVLQWVKSIGKSVQPFHEQQAAPSRVEVIALDEMWHFVRNKKVKCGFSLHWTEGGTMYLTLLSGAEEQRQKTIGLLTSAL